MSYTSILEVLPKALRHPAGLAMIGSLAFHGVLFAGAPLLPVASKAVNSERLVRLIELSPAEQSRLPETSSPTAAFPGPLPDLSSFALPPLSGLPDFSQQPNLFSGNLSSPSSSPGLSSALGSVPLVGVSPDRPLPTGPSIPVVPPPRRPFPTNTPPLPNQLPNLPDAAPIEFPEDNQSLANQIDPSIKDLFNQNQPSPDQSTPTESGVVQKMNERLAKAREESGDPGLTASSENIPVEYPKAACEDRLQGTTILGATVKPNGDLAEEPELLGTSGSKVLDDAAVAAVKNHQFAATGRSQVLFPALAFKYSDEVCSETATPSSTEGSPNPNQSPDPQKTPNNSQSTSQKITIADARIYPKAACKERLQGSTLVAASVKPDGKLAEEPEIRSSSGHQTLDQAAMEVTKEGGFKPTGQSQNVLLDFQFQYSQAACPETTPSQSSSEDSQEAKPEPSQKSSNSSESSKASENPQPKSSSKESAQPASQESSETQESTPQQSPETTEKPTPQQSPEDSQDSAP